MSKDEFLASTDYGDYRTVVYQGIAWDDRGERIWKQHTRTGVIEALAVDTRGFALVASDDIYPISYSSVTSVV